MLEESVRRIDGFRAAHPEFPIELAQYTDLVRDPVGTVDSISGSIYGACGSELHDARSALKTYVDAHPKGSLGAHRYDLSEFGLDAGAVRKRFAGYVERYDVPTESPGLTEPPR